MKRLLVALVLVGCEGPGPVADMDAPAASDGPARRDLGMNDVSILVPLPVAIDQPVIATEKNGDAPLLDYLLMTQVVLGRNDIGPKNLDVLQYGDFHVVGIRFDVCDHLRPGPCPRDVDGVLRLVLQPMYLDDGVIYSHDVAVHVFYPVPRAELPTVLDRLGELAAIQAEPLDSPIKVSPALAAGNLEYRTKLQDLVLTYARADRVMQATVLGQERTSAAFAWVFAGVDVIDGAPRNIVIPDLGPDKTRQTALLAGGDVVFHVRPLADSPRGIATSLAGSTFAESTVAEQRQAVRALVEVMNPMLRDTPNTQCMACHIATHLAVRRADSAGIDLRTLPEWFTSTRNTHIEGLVLDDPRVVRAFGWAGTFPIVSQRVANDTAVVLDDIAAR